MLPKHEPISLTSTLFSATAVMSAMALLSWNLYRFAVAELVLTWWLIPVVVAGIASADFLSGLVHWAADSWGSETMPIFGRRLLRPFRVHHVNPDDFLQRGFFDTNGDVAILTIPLLVVALTLSLDSQANQMVVVFLLAFCSVGILTNQIHQWAHMPNPPSAIRFMQNCHLILGREAHARHHWLPYTANYCITTGWCNPPLAAIAFFRHLEGAVTWLTGLHPRTDEAVFHNTVRTHTSAVRHRPENSDVA